ncbi:hypothetical protein [Rurimicrobium arvi]|uniref:AAA+ ATPase domain-containing protein n=1 Tax=Rurimicrobium arvi TaxID=2049916 RepID=A0ABP8MZA3_9BACT
MKLTERNYFQAVPGYIDIINKDKDLKDSYAFINEVTQYGKEPDTINATADIRETFDMYLQLLNQAIASEGKARAGKGGKAAATSASKSAKAEPVARKKSVKKASPAPQKKKQPEPEPEPEAEPAEKVEHIPSDIALIKRYLSLHDKEKTYEQVLSVWRAFNKAIVERKVTRDSIYKPEITLMNKSLTTALGEAEVLGTLHMVIPAARLKHYQSLAKSVERSTGAALLTEYINISGRKAMGERAQRLITRIDRAIETGKMAGDRYMKEVKSAKAELEAFVNKETELVSVSNYSLNGIGEIAVFGCPCEYGELSGFTRSQNAVVYKLIEEKVKSLSDQELDRAFSDTVAPGLCKTIARKLIEGRQLTMSLIRDPAKVTGVSARKAPRSKFDFKTEVMDMRLRQAGKKKEMPSKVSQAGLGGTDLDSELSSAEEDVRIISAVEMVGMKFRTLGLQGRYRKLIGDPEPGFSAMIYGKPFQGKSTMAIDFAKELTRHGKVLYCVYEEGHGMLLQDKINRNKANVPGLDFANKLPAELRPYNFVFIDSVTDARLNEESFGALIKQYKPQEVSIIGIFHATKDGKFRGGQTFAHDADIVIRVEDGIAHARGRYGPPSEIPIAAIQPDNSNLRQAE